MNPMVLAFFLGPEVKVQRILYKDSLYCSSHKICAHC